MPWKNIERRREKTREYNKRNYAKRTPAQIEADKKRAREWALNNPEKMRERRRKCRLKKKYNMTVEQYNVLFESQGRVCAICKSTHSNSKSSWHIDHCHSTNKIRGILCSLCNIMLGSARDNEYILLESISYLIKNRPKEGVDNGNAN